MNTILIYTLERENLEFRKPPWKILEFRDFKPLEKFSLLFKKFRV